MKQLLSLSDKLTDFFSGRLDPSNLLLEQDVLSVLQCLQAECRYPNELSPDLKIAPYSLLKGLNCSPLAILITDVSGVIQYVNSALESLTGYTQAELLGQTPRVFRSEKTPQADFAQLWQTILSGKPWSGELLNQNKSKRLFWERLLIIPILNALGEVSHFLGIKQDITHQKMAEAELHYQAALLDNVVDAVLSVDLDMLIVSWNRGAEKLYGWAESEVLGHNWLEMQSDCLTSREILDTALETGSWSGQVLQRCQNGQEILVFVTCSLLKDTQNQPSGLVLVNRDLSQHQALQKSLEESETRFKQFANNVDEGIWSFDVETGRSDYVSPSLARIGGLAYQDLLDDPTLWEKHVHPEDLSAFHAFFANKLDQNLPDTGNVEYRFITPDQEEKWFCSRIYARTHNHLIWGITEDISLRKRVEAELVRSERFAYGVLDAISANICVLDSSGMIVAANAEWGHFSVQRKGISDYAGWNYLEVCEQAQGFEREQALIVKAGLVDVLSGVKETFSLEYPCHSNDEPYWFQMRVKRINGDLENRVVVCHQNITEQKRAQAALRQLNEHLEEEVQLRTQALNQSLKELQETNQKLIQANQMKDAFLANMSHELRTPLTGILGMADLLFQQVLGPLQPKQLKSLQTLRDSGQHLLTLINDILDLSKVESGKLELHFEWFEVSGIAQQVLNMVKSMAEEKQITLSLKIEPFDLKLFADIRSFKQVLVNLLSNAIKFTPSQGRVSLETRIEEGSAIFTVIDTGIGIAENDLHKLFRPFTQIDSGLNRKYAGTGLGLSLVKSLVEAHGGKVDVESLLDQGSVFSVAFPLQPDAGIDGLHPVSATPEGVIAPASERKPLILLVDDNPINIEVIQSFLEYSHYDVVALSSGKAALAWLETHLPDLVLMDIQMPEMTGFEVVDKVREFDSTAVAELPVIALTSLAMTGDQEHILKQGFNAYLSKPVNFKDLKQLMQEHLKSK